MKDKVFFISILFLSLLYSIFFIPGDSYSQFKAWRNYYVNTDSAVCIDNIQTQDLLIVTGKVKNSVTGWDIHTVKYILWSGMQQDVLVYSTAYDEEPVDITSDIITGDIYLLCRKSDSTGGSNILILKYSAAGSLIWAKEFDSKNNGDDIPVSFDFQSFSFGNKFLYLTSYSFSGAGSGYDILTQKIDTAGNFIWSKYYDDSTAGRSQDVPVKILSTIDFKFAYIAGTSKDTSDFGQTVLIKYDSSGNLLWKQNWSTAVPRNIAATCLDLRDQRIALGGVINFSGSPDYLVLQYDTTGNLNWSQTYDGTGNGEDFLTGIKMDLNNNVIVTGSSFVNSMRGKDYATIKYTPAGDTSWVNLYNGPASGNDSATVIVVDNFNCIFVCGKSEAINGFYSFGSILYNTQGWSHWDRNFQLPEIAGDNIPVSVSKQQFSNSFAVSGNTFGDTLNSFTSIFYAGVIDGIDDFSSSVLSHELFQNYPNPFNPKTDINYIIRKSSFVRITVYDILGNDIITLVNESQNSGNYHIEFDGSNLASGIYFYTLSSDNISVTRKMLLLK
ncbi:MAG: T9SS type A sorting domain-containing protein [Ignavibacteria bacterium]|nr:T9SS type A sorting domain-containing protein [Ignavibacteria bacterium]